MPSRRRRGFPRARAARATAIPEREAARITFAATRIEALERIEVRLLEMAVEATDDTFARWLEWWADAAWRDADAIRREHDTATGSGS